MNVLCERCGRQVAANWLKRHLNSGCSLGLCDPDAIWSRIDRSGGDDAHWKWKGADDWRYGHLRTTGARTKIKAHVWVWNQVNGAIPKGKELLHTCEERCCNPKHMRLGTRSENVKQAWQEGKLGRKYFYDDVLLMVVLRRIFGLNDNEIANLYADQHMVPYTVSRLIEKWDCGYYHLERL